MTVFHWSDLLTLPEGSSFHDSRGCYYRVLAFGKYRSTSGRLLDYQSVKDEVELPITLDTQNGLFP